MTNKEIFEIFKERYPEIKVNDYRQFCPDFVNGKQTVTIWTDKGDIILFFPKEGDIKC